MEAKGVVGKISEKQWKGRNGPVYLYSFVLNGGNEWFRTGTDKPNFSEGDFITFNYEVANNSNNVDMRSVVKSQKQVEQAPAYKGVAAKPKEDWDARGKYWENKEKRDIEVVEPRITRTAARKDAIAVVGLALANDALVFGNAAKGAKLGIILDAVDEVTERFYSQIMGAAEAPSNEEPNYADPDIKE